MHPYLVARNSCVCVAIYCLSIVLCSDKLSAQPATDSLALTTRSALSLIDTLLIEESKNEALIASLTQQNQLDSLQLATMRELHNRQRARLLVIDEKLQLALAEQQRLTRELQSVQPRLHNLIIPGLGGLGAAILYPGEAQQRLLAGTITFATLISLRYFQVY
jgi:hypothetical protein